MTEQQLQAVLDGVFEALEERFTQNHRPALLAAVRLVKAAVDGLGAPALYAYLKSRGLV